MKNCNRQLIFVSLASVLVMLSGCARERPTANAPSNSIKVDGSKYLLGSEPEGAQGVITIREEAKDQDEVVIVGRIGGRMDPWIKDLAAFLIVDVSLKSCAEIGSDNCPKPWDFC